MVNLRGGLAGLGRGLTYLGQQGMEEQQRVAADQRLQAREAALAAINAQNHEAAAVADADRDIANYKRQSPLVAAREAATLREREPYAVRDDERTAARAETAADRADTRQARHEAAAEGRAVAREEATERRQAAARNDEVVDRFTNDQGFRVLVTRSGQEITLTSRVRETRANSDILGDEGDSGGTGDTPAPTRRTLTPRTPSGPNTPPVPGARRAADGNWYVTRNGRNFRVEQ